MRTCLNCGEHVTPEFVRVFGSNDDRVYACLNCATVSDLMDRAATGPEPAGTGRR